MVRAVSLRRGRGFRSVARDIYKFDLDGNRIEEDETGSQNSTVTYTYNSDNEMLTETDTGDDPYQILYVHDDSGNFVAGYDADGNLLEQNRTGTNPETDTYTWTFQGQMATATVNGVTTTYTYDSNGVRTSETTSGVTTYYLNDPSNPTGYTKAVEEWTVTNGTRQSATLSRSYVLGQQVEAQADSTNGVLVLMHDGHGSTRALLTTSGSIVEQYNYDAYGDLLASNGAQSNASAALTDWLYAGDGEYDADSGLTYQLARYRDGFRFVSMDPTAFGPGELPNANLFLYASQNPVYQIDPSGRFSLVETMAVGAILGGITGASYGAFRGAQVSGHFFSLTTLEYAGLGLAAGATIGASAGALIYGAGVGLASLASYAGEGSALYALIAAEHPTALPAFGLGLISGVVMGVLTPQDAAASAKLAAGAGGGAAMYVYNFFAVENWERFPAGAQAYFDYMLPFLYKSRTVYPWGLVKAASFWMAWFGAGFTVGYATSQAITWTTDKLISWTDSAMSAYGGAMAQAVKNQQNSGGGA